MHRTRLQYPLGRTQAVTTQKTFRLGSDVVNNSWSRITVGSQVAAFGQGSSRPYTIVPFRLASRGLQCRCLLRWVGAPPVDLSSARPLASLRPCRLLLEGVQSARTKGGAKHHLGFCNCLHAGKVNWRAPVRQPQGRRRPHQEPQQHGRGTAASPEAAPPTRKARPPPSTRKQLHGEVWDLGARSPPRLLGASWN